MRSLDGGLLGEDRTRGSVSLSSVRRLKNVAILIMGASTSCSLQEPLEQ